MEVILSGAGSEIWLGEATGDAHGDFNSLFVVPASLAAGDYLVVARIPNSIMVSAPLTIEGQVLYAADDQGGQRDEAEPLLATLPANWSPPTAMPAVAPAPTQPVGQTPSNTPSNLIVIALAAAGVALLALVVRRR
jgi:hypothetical protein